MRFGACTETQSEAHTSCLADSDVCRDTSLPPLKSVLMRLNEPSSSSLSFSMKASGSSRSSGTPIACNRLQMSGARDFVVLDPDVTRVPFAALCSQTVCVYVVTESCRHMHLAYCVQRCVIQFSHGLEVLWIHEHNERIWQG